MCWRRFGFDADPAGKVGGGKGRAPTRHLNLAAILYPRTLEFPIVLRRASSQPEGKGRQRITSILPSRPP